MWLWTVVSKRWNCHLDGREAVKRPRASGDEEETPLLPEQRIN